MSYLQVCSPSYNNWYYVKAIYADCIDMLDVLEYDRSSAVSGDYLDIVQKQFTELQFRVNAS